VTPVGLRVDVAVVTYRRAGYIAELVPHLLAQAGELEAGLPGTHCGVIVVDNDPHASAREIVARFPAVRYVVEPQPGIAAARNRALDEARDSDLLAFVDDDGRPEAGWLVALVRLQAAAGAAAVAGAVVPSFLGPAPTWLVAGRFFVRSRHPTGTAVAAAATNNLLLDLRVIRAWGLRFDPRLGLTGGEDTHFTRSITARGGTIVWSDEAVVSDLVLPERMSRRWLLRRGYSGGNGDVRAAVILAAGRRGRARARARYLLRGSVRVAAGLARTALGVVCRRPHHRELGWWTAVRGAGMVTGALGHDYQEYRRSPSR